jgi:diketogulonate reductase-like aldo/keto reductase
MMTKPLAAAGVQIPEVGLGTWCYYGGVEPLQAGFDAGARFVDTAEVYDVEEVVGRALAGRRESIFVASKVSPAHYRPEDLVRAADASLRRLGTDRMDLYQLHHPSAAVPIAETMGAMESLVDAGKVRFIGVSNFSVPQMKAAMGALRKHPLVSNQVRYNIADRTMEAGVLPFCQAQRITVIAYSPLSREWQRILDCDPGGVLTRVAGECARTPAQVALNWCLCRDGVVVIPKGNTVAHCRENAGASDWRLTETQRRALDEGVRFRRRSGAEMLLRGLIPSGLAPVLKNWAARLPGPIRRRLR